MSLSSCKLMRFFSLAILVFTVGSAQAHTGHAASGLWAGLTHPVGLDHLLAMVAVGVWSVTTLDVSKAWWGPATFLLTMATSASMGAVGLSLPYLEHAISLSVVLFGLMLAFSNYKLPVSIGFGLVAAAAALHGLAHGAETPAAGFSGYAAGFMVTTAALHFTGVSAGAVIRRCIADKATWVIGGLGALCSGAGVYLFSQL